MVLDEATAAFQGLGPKLSSLVDDAQLLLDDADKNYEETSSLIANGETFLDSQLSSSDSIRSWASDLNGFTDELEANDKAVRGILDSVPGAAKQIDGTLVDLGETLPVLIDSGQILGDTAEAYNAPIEQILNVLPRIYAEFLRSTYYHRGGPGLAFRPTANYPGGCTEGFPGSGKPLGQRGSNELADQEYPKGAYCQIPQDDPRVVRGARNLECFEPGSPEGRRAATIYQCRGDGYTIKTGGGTSVTPTIPASPLTTVDDLLAGMNTAGTPMADSGKDQSTPTPWQQLLESTLK